MKRVVTLLAIAFASSCPKDASTSPVDAGVTAAASTAPATAASVERLVFTGAPGWSGSRACTDIEPEHGCDSQWLHTTTGQVVRVFVVPVKDPAALGAFVDKLATDVASRGGVVDRFTQNGLVLVRFLEAMKSDGVDGGTPVDLASINYALVGRDQRAVHLITSVVSFTDQQPADARLRELLGFAAWTLDQAR